VTSRPKNAGRNSQPVICHGINPASTNGATTKKRALPKTAFTFCMVTPLMLSLALTFIVTLPHLFVRSQGQVPCWFADVRCPVRAFPLLTRSGHSPGSELAATPNSAATGSQVRDGLLSEHVFQKREDVGVRFLRRRFVVVQRHTTLETRIGRN
jgi:hypothetical protein